MAKMTNLERAKQFMPFSALRGFDYVIAKKEKIIKDKVELSEDQLNALNETFKEIKKGTIIKVTYYQTDGYITEEGLVSEINFTFKYLKIIKNKINFCNIYKMEITKYV